MSGYWWVPYLIACVGGCIAGFMEVLKKFEARECAALRTVWGWLLILFNLALAPGLLWLVTKPFGRDPSVPLGFVIGITLPALIRTKYTLIKGGLGGDKDVVVDLSLFYDAFMDFFKRQAERSVVGQRQRFVRQVISHFSKVEDLAGVAKKVISEGGSIPVSEIKQAITLVDEVVDNKDYPSAYKRAYLASIILKAADRAYVRKLLKG